MNKDIIILSQSEYDLWDSFVSESHNGTVFHKSFWLMDTGMDFKIYGYFKDQKLIAGIPMTYANRGGFCRASQPNITPYLGVVFPVSNAKYVNRISNEKEICRDIAKKIKEGFNSISIRFTPDFLDLQPFVWEGFTSSVGYTYMLVLDDLDNVWDNMDAKRRNDIRKAERDGIYVEENSDFQQTFELVEKSFQRQNMEVNFKSVAFKHNETLSRRNQCNSFLAKDKNGRAIAVAYIIWDEKRSYYLLGGYDHEMGHHGAAALAIWEAIKFSREKLGLREFDFEGSTIQNVERFFRKFGCRLNYLFVANWMEMPLEITSFGKKLTNSMLNRLKFW